MKRIIKTIVVLLCIIVIIIGCKKELDSDDQIGYTISSIEEVDPTYSWNKYNKLGKPSVSILSNNDNLAMQITGDYIVTAPGNVNSFVDIIFPEDLKYPNVDPMRKTDSDGKLYLNPKEFTIIETESTFKDIKIRTVLANTKNEVQNIENCDIIYMDLIPTVYTKIKIPELEMTLTKDVDIRYAFFKNPDSKVELEDKILLQYSMRTGGIIFVFDKDGKFESLRVFSANSLDGYTYNNLY